MPLDIARIRSAYPALTEGFVHLEGAGGTQPAAPVIEAITHAMRTPVSNRGTTSEPARRSGEIVGAARAAVADLAGLPDPEGVVFGPSATSLIYRMARTLSMAWDPGAEIVVSRLDHDANVRPWVQAAEAAGVTVRWADVDPATGELPVAQYADLIGPDTVLVAVTAASNAIGTVPAVREIADLAHAAGARVFVDGVHASAHRLTDVRALGADFYVTSAYKWSGPHYAALVADPAVLGALMPAKLLPSPGYAPDKFELGTLSFELLAGLTAAVDHLAGLAGTDSESRRDRLAASFQAITEHEDRLTARLLDGLAAIDAVTVCPAPPGRCPTVSFRVGGQAPADTARLLGEQGICVSSGDYYAVEYFLAAGLRDTGGAVRASIYHYNTDEEIDRLLTAVAKLAG